MDVKIEVQKKFVIQNCTWSLAIFLVFNESKSREMII